MRQLDRPKVVAAVWIEEFDSQSDGSSSPNLVYLNFGASLEGRTRGFKGSEMEFRTRSYPFVQELMDWYQEKVRQLKRLKSSAEAQAIEDSIEVLWSLAYCAEILPLANALAVYQVLVGTSGTTSSKSRRLYSLAYANNPLAMW